jgi:hypothetical protein
MVRKLDDVIDRIWQSPRPRLDVALDEVSRMNEHEILRLVAIDVCSRYEALPISHSFNAESHSITIEVGSPQRFWRIEKLVSGSSVRSAVFAYPDVDANFAISVVQGENTKFVSASNRIGNILSALQVARDHTDSILYLPADIREKRLKAYADEFGMTLAQFIFLATWAGKYLAALA